MLILFISFFYLRFISRWYISVWDEMNSLLCTYQQHMYFSYKFDFLSKSRLIFLFIIVSHHVIYDFLFPTESCLFFRHYHLSISVIFIHSRVVLPIRKCVQLSSIYYSIYREDVNDVFSDSSLLMVNRFIMAAVELTSVDSTSLIIWSKFLVLNTRITCEYN